MKKRPYAPVTRGELADLASKLPEGNMRDWCEASGKGPAEQIVFPDGDMLSRCREAANDTSGVGANPSDTDNDPSDEGSANADLIAKGTTAVVQKKKAAKKRAAKKSKTNPKTDSNSDSTSNESNADANLQGQSGQALDSGSDEPQV